MKFVGATGRHDELQKWHGGSGTTAFADGG
jgi:prepilin-type processing-associated H-X9-DG protein